jgi:inner membrane protein
MEPTTTSFVREAWTKSKLLLKAFMIGVLILILQIPTYYVTELIQERQERQQEAINEVSGKWAGTQNIAGPVIVVPYWESAENADKGKIKEYAYFLPDELTVNSTVVPKEKYRGIYKVMLYSSKINMIATFTEIQPEKLAIRAEDILWNEAAVQINVSDTKGLNDELHLNWNGKSYTLTPQVIGQQRNEGLTAPLGITSAEDLKNVHFTLDINLNGSQELKFTPIGKSTTVSMSSSWPHPSFTGDILPQTTEVKDNGFTAQWKSLAFKRNFPQQWKGGAYSITGESGKVIASSSFGAELFVPVNGYQKTMRSIKYAALCIILTFAFFFLVETAYKKHVHAFHYVLIGLALVLFYTLLLSFSEYIGFNTSYLIAALCTIGLIGWFVNGILKSGKLTTIASCILALTYAYIFTILQLQDYSLLLGSVGLFISLGIVMHFSRKINTNP